MLKLAGRMATAYDTKFPALCKRCFLRYVVLFPVLPERRGLFLLGLIGDIIANRVASFAGGIFAQKNQGVFGDHFDDCFYQVV